MSDVTAEEATEQLKRGLAMGNEFLTRIGLSGMQYPAVHAMAHAHALVAVCYAAAQVTGRPPKEMAEYFLGKALEIGRQTDANIRKARKAAAK